MLTSLCIVLARKMDFMINEFSFIFDYNKFSIVDSNENVVFEDIFRKKDFLINDINVCIKTKWFDNFIYRKRVLIFENNHHEEVFFNLKKTRGIWSFSYLGKHFEFHLLRNYKSKIEQDNLLISEIDIENSINSNNWKYSFTCVNLEYLHIIIICFLLFIAVEGNDGLIAPNKNVIGSKF